MQKNKTTVYTEINRAVNTAIVSIADNPEPLSLLRKGVGTALDETAPSPRIAKYVYATSYSQNPDAQNYSVTKIERAIYTALTTYAAVCGNQGVKAHDRENKDSLGRILGRLYTNPKSEKALRNRFERLVTCDEFDSMVRYLGDFTPYLKKANVTMDYGQLAYDLYMFQTDENRSRIANKWGRGFETSMHEREKNNEESKE